MDTTPLGTVTQEKSGLFYVLVRLHQLMQDANPPIDDDIAFALDDEYTQDEVDPALAPPAPFARFLDAEDALLENLANNYADEFANLFTVLAAPLLADPALKAEFVHYAMETFGEEIDFEPESTESPKRRLSIVPVSPAPPEPDAPKKS